MFNGDHVNHKPSFKLQTNFSFQEGEKKTMQTLCNSDYKVRLNIENITALKSFYF